MCSELMLSHSQTPVLAKYVDSGEGSRRNGFEAHGT